MRHDMTRQGLKRHIEAHFGMGIEDFIRYHHQVKLQTHAEIAESLNVSPAMIARLRKQFGINRADGFQRRFQEKYGEDVLEVFQETVEGQGASLSDVARHFGFSRQYASDLYKKIHGRRLREARRAKELTEQKESEPYQQSMDEKGPPKPAPADTDADPYETRHLKTP